LVPHPGWVWAMHEMCVGKLPVVSAGIRAISGRTVHPLQAVSDA
jgi:hypothetical protein